MRPKLATHDRHCESLPIKRFDSDDLCFLATKREPKRANRHGADNNRLDLHDASQVRFVIPVDGAGAKPWNGVTDYCLYRPNGEVVAVVETKRMSRDPRLPPRSSSINNVFIAYAGALRLAGQFVEVILKTRFGSPRSVHPTSLTGSTARFIVRAAKTLREKSTEGSWE